MTDFDFDSLKKHWPSAVVARCKVSEFTGGLFSPGTIANEDSRGTGPAERFSIAGKTAYPVDSFIEWLRQKASKDGGAPNPSKKRRAAAQ